MSRQKIFSSTRHTRIMEVKNILESEGINFSETDSLDSAYVGIFGTMTIYVDSADVLKAKTVLAGLEDLE